MHRNQRADIGRSFDPSLTRRSAIRRCLVGVGGALGVSESLVRAQTAKVAGAAAVGNKNSSAATARIEQQATGSEIWKVTTDEFPQSNIYCEVPYGSADSRYFVYARINPADPANRTELMVVELGTWKQHRLDVSESISGCAISPDGMFYYVKKNSVGELNLLRAELASVSPETVFRLSGGPQPASLGTVSADGRYYAYGCRLDEKWTAFGIALVDLHVSRRVIIDRDPFILNPHPQFEPGAGRRLLIQHNRGGKYSVEGKLEQLVGAEGATIYQLSVPDGKRTELEVGKPYTTPATGHEAWIGETGEILLSVAAHGDFAPEKGNLLAVRANHPPRVVCKGYRFNHVGVSRCGRFFCGDDWRGSYHLVIGSTKTGKSAVVCDSKTVPNSSQRSHPHAYLTPDLKWVVFNSNRSGFPHVYAATVPDGMIEELS